ncbi:methyl-accepting chemotaxis protein [Malaciobacter molluscorum LMG 25693]|uniref:MCP-domain signal transduction protein n=1 Tax=Malaciobacter molluscorum LMG 25693 TaxID=870501 RepID=A0A2G1DIB3_9BACT|nr:methyl-accepting chemotaxis protein [Malaciobacter molluscorum]AXX91818.1 MCP-domain signal transduction protein [Malaciobacter molluscorum LMG 25693]PHO18227.1 methyl-accepting chemotaxis protein [Malaciobacter molluscorum LMG 25693]
MLDIVMKKISNKIIFSLLILMTMSSLTIVYFTTESVKKDSIAVTKENLEMLNTAIFQSLRNAMNTGVPEHIQKAEEEARGIKGVKKLVVAKSQPLIELYAPETKFTNDKDILKSFETKKSQILELKNKEQHNLRMIKPMIATQECLMCHANQQKGDIIGVMDLTFSLNDADSRVFDLVVEILIISTILGWITIGLILIVVKKATNPINKLKVGFKNLLTSNNTNIKLEIESKDEIGEVASLFNQYMDKVREGMKKDEIVIEEANDILEKTSNGFFVYDVKSTAANPYVEDLKNKLNKMILSTRETLNKINDTLKQYSESKFDYKIDDNGIYGDLGTLAAGIKLVGNNTSEILAMIMNTGDQLSNSTHLLSKASNNLSSSSTEQAASLEETASALEEITANIKGNTEATVNMSKLAQNVTGSAKKGMDLANTTASSMEKINEKVTAINEAIEVIDQIAFQTNILSLNAAVEAATAGEAGKGFAVVAQEVRNLASRSAQAAKEIKELVEDATLKTTEGKTISDNMIEGYKELNTHISSTIEMIDSVAVASREQEKGIIQINDAVNNLDIATQNNAKVAEDISKMSSYIASMSDSLVTAASKASFLEEARAGVSNVDLVYDTAKVKVEILKKKNEVYSKLGNYKSWKVQSKNSLNDWLDTYAQTENPKTDNIETIKNLNNILEDKLQKLVDANANKEDNNSLNEKAKDVEVTSSKIFKELNNIKIKED